MILEIETMEWIFKKIIGYAFYTLILGVVFYYVAIPKIIERRARDLGLMKYSADKDKMIAKDSLLLCRWDVYYLQHGNMNGY